jgi:hypothetical protein
MKGLSVGAKLLTETTFNAVGQSVVFDESLKAAFLENAMITVGAFGTMTLLAQRGEQLAKAEKLAETFWQKTGFALKEGIAITNHTIMGAAMSYVAHLIVTHKEQPSPETLREWFLQGASIAVGRYVGHALDTSLARQRKIKQFKQLSAKTEQLLKLAKRVEQHPEAKDAMELLEKRHEVLTEELKLLNEAEKSPERMKELGMSEHELHANRDEIEHQLASVHSGGLAELQLHLAGLHELIPGALWSGTHRQITEVVEKAKASGIKIRATRAPDGKWHVEVEGKHLEIEERAEPQQKAPGLGRSDHDGHAGEYIASSPVKLSGEDHHVRVKRLDSGEVVVTLCSRCQRIRDLASGARTYLEELDKHGARAPHGKDKPKNVEVLIEKMEQLRQDADALEKSANKLTPAELEQKTDALARRLQSMVEKNPALEPVLAVGSREVQPLGVDVQPTVDAAMSGEVMQGGHLADTWVKRELDTKSGTLATEIANAAVAATESEAVANLGDSHKEMHADDRARLEREARRQIAMEYIDRLAESVNAVVDAQRQLTGKKANDPTLAAAERVKNAMPAARLRVVEQLKEPWRYTNAAEFEARVSKLEVGQRVAIMRPIAKERARHFGWDVAKEMGERNRRDVYTDGNLYYSLDTQHGRFEVCGANGGHLREINFDGAQTAPRDKSGGHDLRTGK